MSKWTFLFAVILITSLFVGAGLTAAWWPLGLASSSLPAVAVLSADDAIYQDDGWRRTRDGWERLENFLPAPTMSSHSQPWRRLHPGLLAALQVLLATGALLACRAGGTLPIPRLAGRCV